jgi:hypothetical protein
MYIENVLSAINLVFEASPSHFDAHNSAAIGWGFLSLNDIRRQTYIALRNHKRPLHQLTAPSPNLLANSILFSTPVPSASHIGKSATTYPQPHSKVSSNPLTHAPILGVSRISPTRRIWEARPSGRDLEDDGRV